MLSISLCNLFLCYDGKSTLTECFLFSFVLLYETILFWNYQQLDIVTFLNVILIYEMNSKY